MEKKEFTEAWRQKAASTFPGNLKKVVGHRWVMKSCGCAALTSRKEQTGEEKVHGDRIRYCSACELAWSLGPDNWC